VAGIALTIFSFLFFGRHQAAYSWLLTPGLLLAGVSFLFILFKDDRKGKWLWIMVVIISVVIEQLTEPFLIRYSYKLFIGQNRKLLTEVNQIMRSKTGDVFYLQDSEDSGKFSVNERSKIQQLFSQAGIYMITKDSARVYYGTYGMLDVRLGIAYFYSDKISGDRYERIIDKWYY
jgi:hypothetical protein